ncbi:NADPH-dependent FMN reductase [Candidatus Lucifugimonas marina]|uniref:NADPH-dependent FMN reductase-like domain-containing protein n=1 Tax=Candidatus Lucifugimonas marina TaxID=3038979 RepID=A0AAJ5ZF84_9CHLR|nr:hypothetical protein [SAR202 cluster bacterium JH702]MDG0869571.1 hypothetical protein [SAR202 cluster bacterium JH639]WFG34306.1 hypothetical protein GKN94_00945 [SAR202 cluster bacterium JH545]WFG38235.1 hypothetical protein GKO48_00960 [SAR202 cluster bacterium JH1073]
MSDRLKVLAISGSVRESSFNTALLKAASELTGSEFEFEFYDGIAQLPIFSQELEGTNRPKQATDLDEVIRATDAVLISTPEYNGSLPGGLKNLLDWGSRPYANGPFAGKPVAVISTSTGRYGGARAVEATSDILRHIGASVLNDRLTVASAQSKIDSEGVLRDDITKRSLAHIVERLRDLAKFGVAA